MSWKKYLNENRLKISSRDRRNDFRNEFESDFGRIIFSPAIRRMHDKTQVFPLTDDDNIHSRLTHSLEVMSVGESIALDIIQDPKFKRKSGLDSVEPTRIIPTIVKNACLIHDIGNPPFGHFGETVIQQYFCNLFKNNKKNIEFNISTEEKEDFELFDGNAQGLRVLTKLQVLDDAYGLNLTYATLGAYIKYPNFDKIVDDKTQSNYLRKKKRGVFQSEIKYFNRISDELGISVNEEYIRHPLSYIMEAADSICYLVMDLEDGYNKNWYNYDFIKNEFTGIPFFQELFERLDKKFKNEVTKIVNLRLALIKYFVVLSTNNFIENLDSITSGNYNHELIKDDEQKIAKKLSSFCVKYIFPNKEITSLELTGHSVIKGLLDYFIEFCFSKSDDYRKRGISMISKSTVRATLLETGKESFEQLDDYYKLRIIVDYISGMTDQFALNLYQKLSGQKII